MATDFLKRAEALRAEAWESVQTSPAYAAFRAMDDAVVAIGGRSLLAEAERRSAVTPEVREGMARRAQEIANQGRRISQADAAIAALRRIGKPLSAIDLMDAAKVEGAAVGGERPLTNFTSSLSKDVRLYSFRSGGSYFWWLQGEILPEFWNDPEPNEFARLLGSGSSSSSQEGGDAHAATTAN